jgi:hypothetical protein
MIDAYLDESGIHKSAPVCLIAGYFGGAGQWRKFERDWRKAFKDSHVALEEFHATDFLRKRKHKVLLEKLVEIIPRYKINPVTVGIIVQDFMSFNLMQRRFMTGATLLGRELKTSGSPNRPYFAPFQTCIRRVASYAPVGGKAHFSFGLDRPFGKYAQELYRIIKESQQPGGNRERLGRLSLPLAKETPQLQAADLLACLSFQHLERAMAENDLAIPRDPLLVGCLAKTRMPEDHVFMDKECLQGMLEQTYRLTGLWDGSSAKNVFTLENPGVTPAFDTEDETQLPEA